MNNSLLSENSPNEKECPKDPKEICNILGCSGVDENCPGNLKCGILRKVIKGINLLEAR